MKRKKTDVNTILRVVIRELQETKNRSLKLELRSRRLTVALFVFVAILLFMVYLVFTPYKAVTANQLIVRGNEGELRMCIGPSAITILDEKEIMRARLELGVDGAPSILFYDERQRIRTSYGSYEGGSPRLSFYNERAKCVANLGLDGDGKMAIQVFDATGDRIQSIDLNSLNRIEGIGVGEIANVTP